MTQIYGADYVMRLYFELSPSDLQHKEQLCNLACKHNNLDLCDAHLLPGRPVYNASDIFPMTWRFFPTFDPLVDLFLSRDLDGR